MKITRENYEQYFIDYLDGNLSDEGIIMLENFLLLNPEYRNELEGMERIILKPVEYPFHGKDLLRQIDLSLPVNEENFEDFCVAALEGDLDEDLSGNFQNYLEVNPEKLNEYLIFKQVHLVPDKNIVFPFKDEIKKSVPFLTWKMIYPVISIAATLALIFLIIKYNVEPEDQYANNATENLQNKTEVPNTNLQSPIQEKEEITAVVSQIPVRKKPVPDKKAIIPVKTENKPEEAVISTNEEITDGTNQALLADYNSSLEIEIPVLYENDVTIPKTIYDIHPKGSNENTTTKDYLSLAEFTRKVLNEKVLGKKEDNLSRPSFYDIAGAGIKGINLLTGSKMKLEKKTDASGDTNFLAFESKLFSFSTPVNPKE